MNKKHFEVLFYGLFVTFLFLYIYGFFPIRHSKDQSIGFSCSHENKGPTVDKLVFIVIDALRFDFVKPEDGSLDMPFLQSLLEKEKGCLVKLKAHAPTVTMPRIKAITSGAVPNFIDIFLNFMASELHQDNFIDQALKNGHQVVFYGDDTWLKLFPTAFARSEGTSSFFVTDFTEVDDNVTRNVKAELRRRDWSIMVLHYLGLDHIGHLEGPFSPLVGPKLAEMDSVIEKLYIHLEELRAEGARPLLLVTGDHGMKDSGGHGGVSHAEVTVPLVALGAPCHRLPGWPDTAAAHPLQIDLASTVAFLLDIPVPAGNTGKLIPQLLGGFSRRDVLRCLGLLRNSLHARTSSHAPGSENFESTDEMLAAWLERDRDNEALAREVAARLFTETEHLSETIVRSASQFNLPLMVVASSCLWVILLTALLFIELPKPRTSVQGYLLLGTVTQTLSESASSFIEEEHQSWYFHWNTLCLLMAWDVWRRQKAPSLSHGVLLLPWLHRVLRKLNQTGDKWASLPDIEDFLKSADGEMYLVPLYICSMVLLMFYLKQEKCSKIQYFIFGFGIGSAVCYRAAVKYIYLGSYPVSRGVWEVRAFWTFFSVFLAQSVVRRTPLYLAWSMVAVLLLRPHNVVLVPLQILASRCVDSFFGRGQQVWNGLTHIWIGHVFYFYQGNSNSIASIDVASGYIGLQGYHPAAALPLIMAHTYTFHILAFLLSPYTSWVSTLPRILSLSFYSTLLIFQLDHLFIWSVFTPKLLYDATLAVIIMVLLIVSWFCKKI